MNSSSAYAGYSYGSFITRLFSLFFITAFCLIGSMAYSQWTSNPSVNTSICNLTNQQQSIVMISDGSGGTFIAWTDRRNGVDDDVYAQHYNAAGSPLWTITGAPVTTRQTAQNAQGMVLDGTGGVIIVFGDSRNADGQPDLYAQRLNSTGAKQWTANGVAICNAALNQTLYGIIPDGSGGAIMAWMDRRFGGSYDLFAQRINGSGVVQWTANGVGICTQVDGQEEPSLASDGAGGFIIAWMDDRSGFDTRDIYAQRINSSGTKLWATNGVVVCNAAGDQTHPAVVSDNNGGAIVAWTDWRTGTSSDIYAQRINASGAKLWTSSGVAIATGIQNQPLRSFDSDGFGGLIVAWDTASTTSVDADVYVQRITNEGAVLWGTSGVVLTSVPNRQFTPAVQHMADGGAVISWNDERGPASPGWASASDIFAQRVNGAGVIQWATNGIVVSDAAGPQSNSQVLVLINGDAVIAWLDSRNAFVTDIDLYMQNIHPDGTLGSGSIVVTCCPQGNLSMTAESTGASYQWQADAGSGFIDLSNDGQHSGTNSATLFMSNLPPEHYRYTYRCLVDGLPGSQFKPKPIESWVGSANNNWDNPANWSCSVVPDSNTDVIINSGTIVVSVNTTVRSVTLGSGANITVAPGVSFTIINQ